MITKTIVCALLFCTLALYSCQNKGAVNQVMKVYELPLDTLLRVSKWELLGPFMLDRSNDICERQNQDVFLAYNMREDNICNLSDFTAVKSHIHNLNNSVVSKSIYIQASNYDIMNIFNLHPPATAYLACEINSTENCSVVLLMNAFQSCKLWVNRELEYVVDWKRGMSKYRSEFIPVNLKKGRNFILAKVSIVNTKYVPVKWGFELDITSIEFSKKLYMQEYAKSFIINSLLEHSDTIKIYTGPFCDKPMRITCLNKNNKAQVFSNIFTADSISGQMRVPLNLPFMGLYTCLLDTGNGVVLEQDFYYGNIDKHFDSLRKEYLLLNKLTNTQKLCTEALFERVYINSRRSSSDLDHQAEYWNKVRIPSIVSLNKALSLLKQGYDPFDLFFVRGYQSIYFNSPSFYSAFLKHRTTKDSKLPIVIILERDDVNENRWFNNWRNFDTNNIEEICNLAERHNFIPVWTDCGGCIGENQHIVFNEILADLLDTLPVDSTRIYVIGNCSSTSMALNLMKLNPNKFAGVGFVNPSASNFEGVGPCINTDIAMLYTYYDEVIPKEVSLSFFENLQKINSNAKLFTLYKSTHNCSEPGFWNELLLFFMK